MKPAELYDLLEEAATRSEAQNPIFELPPAGAQRTVNKYERFRLVGKVLIYPRDILDLLNSLT